MFPIRKVIIGLSGGVDSAVAALLLKRKGFDVQGVFIRNWDTTDEHEARCIDKDAEDAEYVCKKLGIPFKEVSFVKEYWNHVLTYMLKYYKNGLIPNLDAVYNKNIKFGSFYQYALNHLGGDALATGHYARTTFGPFLEKFIPEENVSLLRAVDVLMDQTFFLSQVSQEPLRKTMFPIGVLTKSQVKRIASENGFDRIAAKKESTGSCYMGPKNFEKFVKEYISPEPGLVIDLSTGKSEKHDGTKVYVIGQKFHKPGLDESLYVVRKNDVSDIVLAPGNKHPDFLSRMFLTEKPHWISKKPNLKFYAECNFLLQHINTSVQCRLISLKSGQLFVALKEPLMQINPGQFAAFYDSDECLGSAEIIQKGPTYFTLGKFVPDKYVKPIDENGGFMEVNSQ